MACLTETGTQKIIVFADQTDFEKAVSVFCALFDVSCDRPIGPPSEKISAALRLLYDRDMHRLYGSYSDR